MLKSVLCFHMAFIYGTKGEGVRDVDPACRCHQSNVMPDSIFSVNIVQWVTCSFFVLFCFMCVLRGDILGFFIRRDRVLCFFTITLIGLGKP